MSGRANRSASASTLVAGPTLDNEVIDQPAFQPAAPGPDIDLDPVLSERPRQRSGTSPPSGTVPASSLALVRQALPVRRLARLDPGLAEDRVAKRLDRLIRPLGCIPSSHDPLPAQPADRRIERREVIADGIRVRRRGGCSPFASLQHRRLVMLGDGLLAALAVIFRCLGTPLLPTQSFELQPLSSRRNAGMGQKTAADRWPR